MSHLDDTSTVVAVGPATAFFAVVGIILLIWSYTADLDDRAKCEEHGETYIDGKDDYVLCQQDGGVVVKR